ncbi:serine/threonine-protein kinase [Cellulosimicrobium sp. Marseille-Q4280]|uniref:serine/threonine-protein kinase n=1 Tax=Cellulosimicrobium sp. Marseille-Q4280 TaxID=2937992 RepID=UPI002041B561|nr:serine/threonine-protein kinase [Cellulosimicrobium sp. Marseille-Q4280]
MKPVRGLHLGNRYRLVRRIAVGGMGEVWVAADDALGREVAVKVLRSEYAGNEDFLNRLRTEARNSAALSHPNIAQMYDYGEQDRSGYLVMELVVGEPMADLLEREPVLPPSRLLPILSQTARALHAAHVAGVVHRDVKPGNILIDRSGTVKITDFGVSLAANQVPMTATGMVMGTAQYLSPEQAVGQAATGASDVYALGIVAYESVVGNRPFTGSTPVDIAVAHVNEAVPPLPSSVDPELSALIMAMLAKDPLARPRTAAKLAQVLDEIGARLAADPWSARVSGPPTRRSRRGRHEPDDAAPSHTASPGPAAAEAARGGASREDLAPVITPIVIPATVREPHPDDERAAAPPAPPTPVKAGPPAAGPALPWERPSSPTPGTPDEDDDPTTPRSYPPRREMHGTSRTRRPAPAAARPGSPRAATRSTGPAGRPDGSGDRPGAGDRSPSGPPSTRAEMRRQTQDPPGRTTTARRTSTTTGQRIGGIPKGMTWPLVALLGLLLVVLVATIVTGGDGSTDDAARSGVPTTTLFALVQGPGDHGVTS